MSLHDAAGSRQEEGKKTRELEEEAEATLH